MSEPEAPVKPEAPSEPTPEIDQDAPDPYGLSDDKRDDEQE